MYGTADVPTYYTVLRTVRYCVHTYPYRVTTGEQAGQYDTLYRALFNTCPQKYQTNTRNSDSGHLFVFYNVFIKFGLMGWIGIGFALLNTFANCDFYRFIDFFDF